MPVENRWNLQTGDPGGRIEMPSVGQGPIYLLRHRRKEEDGLDNELVCIQMQKKKNGFVRSSEKSKDLW